MTSLSRAKCHANELCISRHYRRLDKSTLGLLVAVGMFLSWCFALADRRVILRRGIRKAVKYFFVALVRRPTWKVLAGIAVIGTALILAAFMLLSQAAWLSLFSALCGMTIGGGIVWFIRIIASLSLRMEALGFGDVLLMAMVGAFIGWQPVGISFFYAPLFALPIVLTLAIVTGQVATPFGPYLCIATIYCLIKWDSIWNEWLQPVLLQIGGMGQVVAMFATMGILMGAMLSLYRILKVALLRKE